MPSLILKFFGTKKPEPMTATQRWNKWAKKNPEKLYLKYKMKRLARYAHPVKLTCARKYCTMMGERHHPDYSKPKHVIFLCKHHHAMARHKNRHLIGSHIGGLLES